MIFLTNHAVKPSGSLEPTYWLRWSEPKEKSGRSSANGMVTGDATRRCGWGPNADVTHRVNWVSWPEEMNYAVVGQAVSRFTKRMQNGGDLQRTVNKIQKTNCRILISRCDPFDFFGPYARCTSFPNLIIVGLYFARASLQKHPKRRVWSHLVNLCQRPLFCFKAGLSIAEFMVNRRWTVLDTNSHTSASEQYGVESGTCIPPISMVTSNSPMLFAHP